jgi:DNA-directed RNA polymerase III subunit RPC1
MEVTDRELGEKRFVTECSPVYRTSVRDFVAEHVAQKMVDERKERGMFDALEREADWDEDTDLSLGASGAF